MSTAGPNSNDRDETPDAVAPETSAVPPPAPPAPRQEPAVEEAPGTVTPDPGPGATEPHLAGAPSPAAPGAVDEPAADPPPTGAHLASPQSPARPAEDTTLAPAGAAPAPVSEEPATRQLPTEAEDEALRAERARRFGRVASSGGEPVESDQPDTVVAGGAGTGAGAGVGAGTGAAAGAGAGYAVGTADTERTTRLPADGAEVPPVEEDDPFRDFDEGPRSRAAAHWWGILIALVFGPVTWYLVTDGGERISYALSQNLESINVMGLVELGGGLLTLILLLMAARWSSVGSIIIGSIGTVIGAAFLAVPQLVADFLASQSMIFDRLGQFGTNVFDHLVSDGHSGRLLLYGITFIFVGVISHGARRQGRREERRKATLGL